MAILTSARQTKRKIIISLQTQVPVTCWTVADTCVVKYVRAYAKVCLCWYRNWHNLVYGGASNLETLLRGDVNFRSTNEVDVLIVISF